MEFEFDKFVKDIEKRQVQQENKRTENQDVYNHDEARRLRDQRYFERWQNRIVWEQK